MIHTDLRYTSELPRLCLEVLGIIMDQRRRGQRVTCRSLAQERGVNAAGSHMEALRRLRACGLIEWEDGRAATIRPTCKVLLP